ncbi:uncharacterized protein LOC107269594 isoform X3 [Cephus cinctus]|uniref:Uncharacterized protein LOC107269594 isoform X3 n=1 Tax=Cephus cinctus TaxID=211228 RepID=A0AAJ7RLA3_CEPCN|nr:uncharacterized protein LOC107269594 isoform X3 [Cephus cinctus]
MYTLVEPGCGTTGIGGRDTATTIWIWYGTDGTASSRNMAPTICLAEIPMPKIASNPYAHRRQKIHNSGVIKQQKLEIVQMLNVATDDLSLSSSESSLWKAGCPTNSCVPAIGSSSNTAAKVPVDLHEHWRNILIRREGLLNIVSRTMALVRRNHILQKRINALRMETRDFIRSVLGNPKNKSVQEDDSTTRIKKEMDLDCEKEVTQMKDSIVSSSSEDTCETFCFSPSSPDSTSSLENCVTSGSCVSMDVDSDSLDDPDAIDDSVL